MHCLAGGVWQGHQQFATHTGVGGSGTGEDKAHVTGDCCRGQIDSLAQADHPAVIGGRQVLQSLQGDGFTGFELSRVGGDNSQPARAGFGVLASLQRRLQLSRRIRCKAMNCATVARYQRCSSVRRLQYDVLAPVFAAAGIDGVDLYSPAGLIIT